jgi:hypothetical protein
LSKPACTCVKQANKKLAAHNTVIDTATLIQMPSGLMYETMPIPTVKVDSSKRGRPLRVSATYCPFCGIKYGPNARVI